jgi:hypothetical protein
MWQGKNNRNFFMGHSSINPSGNACEGVSVGISDNAAVEYSRFVWVNSVPAGSPGPLMSTQILKNLYISEGVPGAVTRRVGINTLAERNVVHIRSNVPQSTLHPLTSGTNNTLKG